MTDSTNWSDEKKHQAAARFEERLAYLASDPTYRAEIKRAQVGNTLSIAISKSATPYETVAERAGMSQPVLHDHLIGDVNFSLDSIDRISRAIGYDFDVVLRKSGESYALQPWNHHSNVPPTLIWVDDWYSLPILIHALLVPIATIGALLT